jgi:DNA cross-link repair 1A protein
MTMTTRKSSTKPLTPQATSKINAPTLGRQSSKKVAYSKAAGKPNGNILNFFQKVDGPIKEERPLFLSQGSVKVQNNNSRTPRSPSPDIFNASEEDDLFRAGTEAGDRYNESVSSVKRRKLSSGSISTQHEGQERTGDSTISKELVGATLPKDQSGSTTPIAGPCTPPPPDATIATKPKPRRIGPFLDESEDEEDLDSNNEPVASTTELVKTLPIDQDEIVENKPIVPEIEAVVPLSDDANSAATISKTSSKTVHDDAVSIPNSPIIPSLKKESTSADDFVGFDDLEDFPDYDEFADGEEFVERKWMEEQARLEAAEDGFQEADIDQITPEQGTTASCPICDGDLSGLGSDQTSKHVNACLDGKPIPIPVTVKTETPKSKMMPPGAGSRFSRAAIARPGQANPFDLIGSTDTSPSSAFSKLMSSHAEDAAWANAAAAEQAARGKPAYQRTCPFYKIMPGFYICVDAFRYGAVQGCNAYFLSHFHSDHYIGLTSTWSHGPIYCSKVTGNLVKQQLRVDPKWVVSLDFESRVEVPGTQGVAVTMIPANHCPGSSLFLFEKVVGKGKNPKIQRVLHCGDFRACPTHIAHPLLMPDIVDSITGKSKQQKIDVCYLDTTYLNPRYAFPCQEDVIKACADMCVSLKKERAEESDAWEKVKQERAGSGMTKFIGASVQASDDSIAMEIGSTKARGRLLVVCGTYSIGKERICMGIARALDCKIWAPPGKQRICAALEDPELMARLTDDPREAQIHMQMLMEIRAETLQDYLNGFKPHFSRIVGFRPSGWNYRPPNSR